MCKLSIKKKKTNENCGVTQKIYCTLISFFFVCSCVLQKFGFFFFVGQAYNSEKIMSMSCTRNFYLFFYYYDNMCEIVGKFLWIKLRDTLYLYIMSHTRMNIWKHKTLAKKKLIYWIIYAIFDLSFILVLGTIKKKLHKSTIYSYILYNLSNF